MKIPRYELIALLMFCVVLAMPFFGYDPDTLLSFIALSPALIVVAGAVLAVPMLIIGMLFGRCK